MRGNTWSVFYDNRLVTRYNLDGTYLSNQGDIFIGGFFNNVCLPDAAFDNVMVFKQPLTIDEINILTLANKVPG